MVATCLWRRRHRRRRRGKRRHHRRRCHARRHGWRHRRPRRRGKRRHHRRLRGKRRRCPRRCHARHHGWRRRLRRRRGLHRRRPRAHYSMDGGRNHPRLRRARGGWRRHRHGRWSSSHRQPRTATLGNRASSRQSRPAPHWRNGATACHRASHGRRHTGAMRGGQRPALPSPMATVFTPRPLLSSSPHTGAAGRHGADRPHKSGRHRRARQHDSDLARALPPPSHWGGGPPRGGSRPQVWAPPPRATARQRSRHGSAPSHTLKRRAATGRIAPTNRGGAAPRDSTTRIAPRLCPPPHTGAVAVWATAGPCLSLHA